MTGFTLCLAARRLVVRPALNAFRQIRESLPPGGEEAFERHRTRKHVAQLSGIHLAQTPRADRTVWIEVSFRHTLDFKPKNVRLNQDFGVFQYCTLHQLDCLTRSPPARLAKVIVCDVVDSKLIDLDPLIVQSFLSALALATGSALLGTKLESRPASR
jgi:hypothetical protein